MDNFIKIKGLTPEQEIAVLEELKDRESSYHNVPGWKVDDVFWIDIINVNRKQPDGTTNNSIRLGGTGEQDSLEADVAKGLLSTVPLLSLWASSVHENDLLDWFNRVEEFERQGYTRLPAVRYVRDEPTEFQKTEQDAVDDFRAVANRRTGQKPITDNEVHELLRNRFESYLPIETEDEFESLKDKMVIYLEELDLGLSSNEIKGKANTVIRDFKRRGNVEYFSREDAETWAERMNEFWQTQYEQTEDDKFDINPKVVNAKDSTRVLRMFKQLMQDFIKTHEPYEFITFNSGATSHDEIDTGVKETLEELEELQKLVIDYVNTYHYVYDGGTHTPTWDYKGSIPQKIRKDGSIPKNDLGLAS